MTPGAAWIALLGFLGVLAAYVALALTGHDTAGLVQALVTLAGVGGLGVHFERRTQEQNVRIAKIDKQTNGVLDQRILDGAHKAISTALVEHGLTGADTVKPKPTTRRRTVKTPA